MELKVYTALAGLEYEGFSILGVFTDVEGAHTALDDPGHCDYIEIQVFALNGERLYDDPQEFFKNLR
jgi:hypothetical protein